MIIILFKTSTPYSYAVPRSNIFRETCQGRADELGSGTAIRGC